MLKVVTLFSGGGGVEAGLKDAMGEFDGYAVEFNPNKVKVSEQILSCYRRNFPTHKLFPRTVQDMANAGFPGIPQNPDLLWASPECIYSSQASNSKKANCFEENSQAIATSQAVYQLQPQHFCLENVPQYANTIAFKYFICKNLAQMGYQYKFKVIRLTSHQTRDRLILWASKDVLLPEPQSAEVKGWWDLLEGLVEALPVGGLSAAQSKYSVVESPTWLNRVSRAARPIPADKPVGTITRSLFTDGKGSNRTKFASIILPNGKVKQASIECIKRLQEFPDWYHLPEEVAIAGTILGNAVPPGFISRWLGAYFQSCALSVKHRTEGCFTPQNIQKEGGSTCLLVEEESVEGLLRKDNQSCALSVKHRTEGCFTPQNIQAMEQHGTITYDRTKSRWLYVYRRLKQGQWRQTSKHIQSHLVGVVQEARSRGETVEQILRLL